MKKSVKTMAKVTSSVLAASLVVMTPFSGVGVYAESATTIICQQDIYEAINTPDVETDKGIIFTNNYDDDYQGYELVLTAGNYKLEENINLSYATSYDCYLSVYSGDVSIDLNGHNLTDAYLYAEGENTSFALSGDGYVNYGFGVEEGATATISGGKFGDEVYSYKGSSLTISDGTFDYDVYAEKGSSLTISDGSFDDDVYAEEGSSLTISDGTFEEYVYAENESSLKINGGTYEYETWLEFGSTGTINGGTFDSTVYAYDGCDLTVNGGSFTGISTYIKSDDDEPDKITINGGTINDSVYVGYKSSLTITGGIINGDVDAEECESVKVSGGTLNGYNYGLGAYGCSSLAVSGGTFTGGMCGLYSDRDGDISLSGGTFTATGIFPEDEDEPKVKAVEGEMVFAAVDDPLSGIYFVCENEAKAKTIFADVLADGYEYSPAITPASELYSEDAGTYAAYTDQTSFSVKKIPVDPVDPGDDKGGSDKKDDKKYSNEWVDGKWYNADGTQTYAPTMSWKQNETGWWIEDTSGWYPKFEWVKIDGKWYFFCADGYMDYSEYRDGCWLGDDGAWVEEYYGGHWMQDSTGWWYEDASGWYPVSRWLWIDGSCYYFEASGYMATSKYVDGCWVGADGAWVK